MGGMQAVIGERNMRRIHRVFVGIATLVSAAAAPAADAPKPATQEFAVSNKTIAQYLADGWELKSTTVGGRGILMFFSMGRHLAMCTLGEQRTGNGKSLPITDGCFESQG